METFSDPADFLSALTTDQHCFNFARKNRARGDFTPADLLAARAPDVSPKILLLTPILPDAQADQDLSRPPATWIIATRAGLGISGRDARGAGVGARPACVG